jgi:hypothetical protein
VSRGVRVADLSTTALIGAAAGLVGAVIGSVSTFQAGRAQWRREARRQAYAELLTAAHDLANLLEADAMEASDEDTSTESTLSASTVIPFLAALDAATLLGSYRTQWVLTQWRSLATSGLRGIPSQMRVPPSLPTAQDWGTYLIRFLIEAKKELRILSVDQYQRVAVGIGTAAGFGFLLALAPLFGPGFDPTPPIPVDESFKRSGYIALYVALTLLAVTIFYLRRAHLSRMAIACVLIGTAFLTMSGLRPTETVSSIYFMLTALLFFGMLRKWLEWQYPFEKWLWTADSVLADV